MSTVEHEALSHHLPAAAVAHQQRRVVQFFILADAIFFACLLFSYYYLRSLNVDGGWLNHEGQQTAASWLVWVITAVTVLSAVAYRSGETGIRRGVRSRFQSGALIGIILVVLAIGLMVYQARTWPILMSDGAYSSMFIVMAGVQSVHLVILLVVGIGVWNRGIKGKLDDGNYNHATLVGYFWYWVALTSVLSAITTFTVY